MEKPLSALRRMARETSAAIVLVHHRGKGAADFRGSSVIVDQTDMLFALGRETGDPEQRTRRKLHTAKCRIDEEPEARWLAITADRSRGLVTVDQAEPYEPEGGRPRDTLRDDVLALLTGISQSGARIARALGREKTDGTVRRLLDDLQAAGLAEKRPDGWGLPTPTSLGVGNPGNPPEIPVNTGDQGLPKGLPGDRAGEHPDGSLDDALKAEPCRCERPLPAPDGAEIRCARCGHATGWTA